MGLFSSSKSKAGSSELPLHSTSHSDERSRRSQSRTRLGQNRPHRRTIAFATEEESWARVLRRWIHKIKDASTGEPSDGLSNTESSSSVPQFLAGQRREAEDEDWAVEEIVVNHELEEHEPLGSQHSQHSNVHPRQSTTRQSDSNGSVHKLSFWEDDRLTGSPARQALAVVFNFFNPRFEDPEREQDFQKQIWYSNKPLALYASLYLIVNWILYLILNRSDTLYEKYTYYGGLTLFTLPVPFLVIDNWPRKHPVFFQIWLAIATWYCGITELIQMRQCEFFSPTHNTCHGKDFLAQLYYVVALPTMMMTVVSQRIYNFIFEVIVLILYSTIILPDQHIYARNVVSFFLFAMFIQFVNYAREMTERRMYMLNSQLKIAYRAQQKAQIAESKASQAKRRFASYIFHEVRVPLNTAMLAFQNLQGGAAFRSAVDQNQGVEIYAMESSLTMMQQVLNDVLDLQKMDAGRFESSPRPFALHRAIMSIVGPVGVATAAKRIELQTELDPRIDTMPGACGKEEEGLWVIGDEIRLLQVLSNLTSNAVKFTPEGGGPVRIVTKLLSPVGVAGREGMEEKPKVYAADGEDEKIPEENGKSSPLVQGNEKRLVFRLEVHDSGPGIRPSDLVDSRLFQPFVQTRVGKLSGKGSGLGLAIVRQIVHLSGGRLDVSSRKGKGAKFWVELVYNLATPAEVAAARETHALTSPAAPPSQIATLIRPTMPEAGVLEGDKQVSFSSTSTDSEFPPTIPPIDIQSGIQPTVAANDSPQTSLCTPLPRYDSTGRHSTGPPPFASVPASASPVPEAAAVSLGKSTSTPILARPEVPTSTSSLIIPANSPLRVLVVDDDALTRTLMTRMLTKLGCAVDTAEDGQQCLDILLGRNDGSTGKEYDLISLDNYMPVMTGEEAVRQLRALGRRDLVVGCTGTALTEDQVSYIEAGADRVLAKPIMLKDLKAILQAAQERRTSEAPAPISASLNS